MDPHLWERATAIFEAALPLDESQREALLDEACAGDPELLQVVEGMLAADESTQWLDASPAAWAEFADADSAPSKMGPWRVIREIGRGGMGAVYLGVRDDGRFERTVALKVVPRSRASTDALERFQAEARILAGLEHPHIARLYDVGVDDGRPYLVMEYVEGEPIDRWCDDRRLGVRARLELFRQVCDAVQFAHRNLVIHRDIKPSNILVTDDGVRLLDFGIARLVRDEDAEAPATRFGALTPEYASPEQIQGRALTTASDVYALGLVLYELLTGRRPFPAASGDLQSLAERSTREPDSPSAVVEGASERPSPDGTTSRIPPDDVAAARGSSPRALRRLLRGDLDRIVLKALRTDPDRRYPSAEALSEDLRRFLHGLPVSARALSPAYRASVFMRRHKVGVLLGSVAVLGLIVATGTALSQARAARLERDASARAFSFLEELLVSPDPLQGGGVAADSIRMVDVIDRAAERVATELTGEPEVRARMLGLLGRVNVNLGRGQAAIDLLEQAVTAGRDAFGPSLPLAEITGRLGFALDQFGDRERGESLIREALALAMAEAPEGTLVTAEWQEYLGRSLMDSRRLDEAEPMLRASYETRVRLLDSDHGDILASLNALGSLYSLQGDHPQAARMLEDALDRYRAADREGHPDFAVTEANLSLVYLNMGRPEDAERTATSAVEHLLATFGPRHFLTATSWARLAGMRGQLGRSDEADSLYTLGLEALEEAAPGSIALPVELGNYAVFLRRQGRFAEAESVARRGMEAAARIVGEDHPIYAGALQRVADAVREDGRPAEAEPLLLQARELYGERLGSEHPETQAAAVSLARTWVALGRDVEAERLLEAVVRTGTASRGSEDPVVDQAREALRELTEARDAR